MSVVSWRRMASDLTDQVRELQKERDELLAEVERLNRVVVSQSQQLGNTRSQREHELIEELADAEGEVAKAWSERDHYLNAVMERNTELRKAEAEVALRDRMIRISFEDAYPMHGDTYDSGGIYRKWLADLRARAGSAPRYALEADQERGQVLQLGIEKDAEEYRANVAEAERDRLAWMLERIRDSEYDRMSDADALADLAARYDARHEGRDG